MGAFSSHTNMRIRHTHSCCFRRRSLALLSASWSARPWGGSSLRLPESAVVESAWPSRSRDSSAILWERQGGIRGRMRQGTERRREERRLEETCRTSNIRQRRGTMQYLTGIFVAQAWNDFGWRTFKLSLKQTRSNASPFIYEASLFEKITSGGILVSPSANSTDQKLISHATLISNYFFSFFPLKVGNRSQTHIRRLKLGFRFGTLTLHLIFKIFLERPHIVIISEFFLIQESRKRSRASKKT